MIIAGLEAPELVFGWREETIAIEQLPQESYLYRRHVNAAEIPGDFAASCVIAVVAPFVGEVKGWKGDSPTVGDAKAIKKFCESIGLSLAFWRRVESGKEDRFVILLNIPNRRRTKKVF